MGLLSHDSILTLNELNDLSDSQELAADSINNFTNISKL